MVGMLDCEVLGSLEFGANVEMGGSTIREDVNV